jgi:hypothetical protein
MGISMWPRVVVKFLDDDDLSQRGLERQADISRLLVELEEAQDRDTVRRLFDELVRVAPVNVDFTGLFVERIITSVEPDQVRLLLRDAVDREFRPANLLRFFTIERERGFSEDEALAAAETLRAWEIVETAYVESAPVEPPTNLGSGAGLSAIATLQPYLGPAEVVGINAEFVWERTEIKGAGARVIDIERGWNIAPVHSDLAGASLDFFHADLIELAHRVHGNRVLGVIFARHPPSNGGSGISPDADGKLVSIRRRNRVSGLDEYNPLGAIVTALLGRRPGDVLLLEDQVAWTGKTPDGSSTFIPMLPSEIYSHVLEGIRTASALGVTVIEAGGNGSKDLDAVAADILASEGRNILSNRDSGAILVGAVRARRASGKLLRLASSNFGCRVDCYAPGQEILTTSDVVDGGAHDTFTNIFGQTSGAAAIVAGAAALLQSAAKAHGVPGFRPSDLRNLLRRPDLNTAVDEAACATNGRTPVMPDLRRIFEDLGWA